MAEPTAPRPDLGHSIEVMRSAHEGQVDKSGRPYYLHPLRVAMRLALCSAEERHAALLHDVVEDTPVTLDDLRAMGYADGVIELIDLLTRRLPQGESHRQYIERIVASANTRALRVKLADLYDNLSPSRIAGLAPHERGLRHRFAKDAERIAGALVQLRDPLVDKVIRGEL